MIIRRQNTAMDRDQLLTAKALYEAGQTDAEIAAGIGFPAFQIEAWRRRMDLPENRPEPSEAVRAYEQRASVAPAPASPPPSAPPPSIAPPPQPAPPMPQPPRQAPLPASDVRRPPGRPPAPPMDLDNGTGVQPTGANALEIGSNGDRPVLIDLEEMLATRLLVQGNSGSGKSHLLRRIIEESAATVQQIIIDPEGDFVTIGDTFGHMVIDATAHTKEQLSRIAGRVREHRASIVLNLGSADLGQQMTATAAFLDGLFDAPTPHWFPALVFVDEAQVFAPAHNAQVDVDSEIRASCVMAMTNLMCRGRKRGLSGILATQRLAKLSSNVAGEVSNFLMGRTFYDNDIGRAADLLGMGKRDAQQIGDLQRGEFIGVGSAIARRPLKVKIGATQTKSPNAAPSVTPLPTLNRDDLQSLLIPDEEESEGAPAPSAEQPPRLRVVGA
jgi:hypothetical protein